MTTVTERGSGEIEKSNAKMNFAVGDTKFANKKSRRKKRDRTEKDEHLEVMSHCRIDWLKEEK